MWQQGEPGVMIWGAALTYCEGLSLGGHSDWRLPNNKEFESLVDSNQWDPAIDTAFFPDTYADGYWSSTSNADYPNMAWLVDFYDGGVSSTSNKENSANVRCVRSGQSAPIITFTGLTISGPSSVNENSSASYSAMANWSDGSTSTVTPTWGEDSAFASISTEGLLTTTAVAGNQTVTITASYTAGDVTKTATKAVTIAELSPSVTVTSPNGSENWVAGTTQTITWTYTGNPGTSVKIKLLLNGIVVKTITTGTPVGTYGSGSFDWSIPLSQATGAKYRIKVISTIDSSFKDTSDANFAISPPSITVISPNGGETWTTGSQQTIQWTYKGNPGGSVKIKLLRKGLVVKTITPNAPIGSNGNGSFVWDIPFDLAVGGGYKIKVISTSNSIYKDKNDGKFSIQ
jgi:hypothetical protein